MQNLEKEENMIMRDGEFSAMMQQQDGDKAQKSMDKEQHAMSSTPTGDDFLLIQSVLSLHHFSSLPYPRTRALPQK